MFSYVILKKQGYRVLIVEHNLFLYKVDEEMLELCSNADRASS